MLVRPLLFFKKIYHEIIWDIPTQKQEIFLTFDDGPSPELTPWVLDLLDKYNAKVTFFCLGKNVERHPEIYNEIIKRGHAVGNHTYSHLNGWKVNSDDYLQDVELAADITPSNLFRPPYAKITKSQRKCIAKRYKIVMWSILSRDYSRQISGKECVKNVLSDAYPGAIIVFHDSVKSAENLFYALPIILRKLKNKGYTFKEIKL